MVSPLELRLHRILARRAPGMSSFDATTTVCQAEQFSLARLSAAVGIPGNNVAHSACELTPEIRDS
jgi:hypothetical protein